MMEFQNLQLLLLLPDLVGLRCCRKGNSVYSSRNCLTSILPNRVELLLQRVGFRHFGRKDMGTVELEHRLGMERIHNNKDCRQD